MSAGGLDTLAYKSWPPVGYKGGKETIMHPIRRLKRLLALLLFAGAGLTAELCRPGPCPLVPTSSATPLKRRALR
jgi:hypothetical protein